ncbi:transcriptional regulator [Novosphingobium marinum]|uniref:Transcriptional regulator n=1 Tax=Novosphingobium marinum TaxID=1514948 RepID=A0A7Y9XXJ6_9SPHN|nr:FMN-binding negative transcriptional regulator [Novosphingobium marinum]NYH96446.1 transcriptional regulator [Novosphingobium marinum]GGC35290.1 transcriptional regulator [Novosphingobium marinum]
MHPHQAFRFEDRAVLEALVEQIGFGMVFAATPHGPRVAHTPLFSTGDGAVQFHLSNGNALTAHLDGETVLAVVNGPDAYVSPRWYGDREEVPTWNYVSVELEGRVRRMDGDGLDGMLRTLVETHEERLGNGEAWSMDEVPDDKLRPMMRYITGFEMEVQAWRPTFKLSQNHPAADRARVIEGLERAGSPALAELMRTFAP